MRFVLALACMMAVACGPSNLEIKTAKASTYAVDPRALFQLAEQAAQDEYQLGVVDDINLQFATKARFYSATGDLESPGADGFVQMRAGSVELVLIVQLVRVDAQHLAVRVVPKTFQVVAGSPKPRELKPDDPYLPPWILGRADALSLRIHDLARAYVSPAASTTVTTAP